MFTLKLYRHNGEYMRIYEADYFTILKNENRAPYWAEITMHRNNGNDLRCDVGNSPHAPDGGLWERAIIENSAGKTTDIIGVNIPPQQRQGGPA